MGLVSLSNLANGGAFKMSLGLFIIGTMIMMLMTKLRKLFTKNKKQAIIYLIFVLLTFALVGLLSSSKVLNDTPLNSFFGFQFMFLGLGSLHLFILRKYFSELSKNKKHFFSEFLFTIAFLLIGLIAFHNVVGRFRAPFSLIFMASSIFFLIPLLFYKLYEFALQIPVPIYNQWLYPVGENIKDPTKKELQNPLVISFEFQKKPDENDITNFRVKAPENMEFGKLFYFFINDYNEKHPESKIDFLKSDNQEPHGWIFYYKPNWWSSLKHISFDNTISWNNIKEDNVIICQRAIQSLD